jgi:hypothetical protein
MTNGNDSMKLSKLKEWIDYRLQQLHIDEEFFKNNNKIAAKITAFEEIKHRLDNIIKD